jgi:hypothetical protein
MTPDRIVVEPLTTLSAMSPFTKLIQNSQSKEEVSCCWALVANRAKHGFRQTSQSIHVSLI